MPQDWQCWTCGWWVLCSLQTTTLQSINCAVFDWWLMDTLGDCRLTDWLIDMLSDCWLIHCFIIDWLISWLAVAWLTDCWLISRPVVDWLVGCLQTHGHGWGQHSSGNPSGCWGVGQASHCYCHTWPVQSGAYSAPSVCPVWCVPCCLSLCVQPGAYPAVSLSLCVSSLVCTLLSLSLSVSNLVRTLLSLSVCPVWCIPCCLSVCPVWCVPCCVCVCVQSGRYPAVSLCPIWCVPCCLSLTLCVSHLVCPLLSLSLCPVWCVPCCLSVSSLVCTLLSLSLSVVGISFTGFCCCGWIWYVPRHIYCILCTCDITLVSLGSQPSCFWGELVRKTLILTPEKTVGVYMCVCIHVCVCVLIMK